MFIDFVELRWFHLKFFKKTFKIKLKYLSPDVQAKALANLLQMQKFNTSTI